MSKNSNTRGRRRKGRSHKRGSKPKPPVPIHKRSSSHFQPKDRDRGEELVDQDRVDVEMTETRARAYVADDDREYAVGFDWTLVPEKRALHGFCECDRFAGGTPCEHLWAVLAVLGKAGTDKQPAGRDRVSLKKDRAANWGDLDLSEDLREDRRGKGGRGGRKGQRGGRKGGGPDSWRSLFDSVREEVDRLSGSSDLAEESGQKLRDVRFLVNTSASEKAGGLVLDIFGPAGSRRKGRNLKRIRLRPEELDRLLQPRDSSDADAAEIGGVVAALPVDSKGRKGGRKQRGGRRGRRSSRGTTIQSLRLPPRLYESVVPHLCSEGVLGWWNGRNVGNPPTLSWDEEEPWRLALKLDIASGGGARLSGALEHEGQGESVPLGDAKLILTGNGAGSVNGTSGLVVFGRSVARLQAASEAEVPWIDLLRETGDVVIPEEDLEEALDSLLELPALPKIETPSELELSVKRSPPQPRLVLEPISGPSDVEAPLLAELSFVYDGLEVDAGDSESSVLDLEKGVYVRRDMELERNALVRLLELGMEPVELSHNHELQITPRELPTVAEPLLLDGWEVEVHGRSLRSPSPPKLRVETGIDWFEVSGEVDFAGTRFEMNEVLDAVTRGDRFVTLEDGSKGLLPDSWMETYDSLSQLAHESTEEGLRFLPSQALFVDSLLAVMPPADVDREFSELREKLRSFDRIEPRKEPRSFQGTLREYQREGLGWLTFLREFGLGGILADDMGLGKTVQVLALLRAYRTPSKTTGLPSLVVAPRSLVYNWLEEAERFTPGLEMAEYLGAEREELKGRLDDFDLVVTTYGTLRRDVDFLATVEFDTVILDEAQAIKNPESQTAKASRLLHGRHRLALTGTPIENHLGELGSIFEFLNPGLLGRLPKLDVLASGGTPSQRQLELVAQGIRPFILRRTKSEVLKDLPPKTEQVLYCSLREDQRELYDRLRARYQASLLDQVESEGMSGSTMQVLEALLRLRQVACHPGLVDESWEDAGSAKLESLFEQVTEILEEGHKVIVFSQFTSLLAYVRKGLDERGVPFAYLDGQTRNRGEVVDQFQSDPSCNVFLISLKAGGLGLNLTAAGYVFLLDPWWNPAVEAQAIDRAHRIGQDQPVFAYRMIARDTVEEKIIELQRSKRRLADTVLEADSQSLADLTADDLRMLLS